MKPLHGISLIVVILGCGGCPTYGTGPYQEGTTATPESREVQIVQTVNRNKCQFINIVSGSEGQMYNNEAERSIAMVRLLNKAASIGGNTIQIIEPAEKAVIGTTVISASVWNCDT